MGGAGGSYAYADTATKVAFALTKNRLTPDLNARRADRPDRHRGDYKSVIGGDGPDEGVTTMRVFMVRLIWRVSNAMPA